MQSDYEFTTKCALNKRCDRCDFPLHISTYKEVRVFIANQNIKRLTINGKGYGFYQ